MKFKGMGMSFKNVRDTVKGYVGDWDTALSYRSAQFVDLRDWRLGTLSLLLRLGIFCYVIIYQIVFQQRYSIDSGIIGTVRMSMLEPEQKYRAASPPYCLGVNSSSDPAYTFPSPGTYAYQGSSPAPQGICRYLDATYAVPDPLETSALLLSSRIVVTPEAVQPAASCSGLSFPVCTWSPLSSELQYIPDVNMFTLMLEHSMAATTGKLARSSVQLNGVMLDANGKPLNPCSPYDRLNVACPAYVNIGALGQNDIFPIQVRHVAWLNALRCAVSP